MMIMIHNRTKTQSSVEATIRAGLSTQFWAELSVIFSDLLPLESVYEMCTHGRVGGWGWQWQRNKRIWNGWMAKGLALKLEIGWSGLHQPMG
jgi:hypothetical protein